MAWLAKDINGSEHIFNVNPYREEGCWYNPRGFSNGQTIRLPKGSIKKLIGRELEWNNEPVELKEE